MNFKIRILFFNYFIIISRHAHKKNRPRLLSRSSRIHANRNYTYTYREFIHGIHYRAQIEDTRAVCVVAALRMLVINAVRPLSHARSPFFRASNFRSLRTHTRWRNANQRPVSLRKERRTDESVIKITNLTSLNFEQHESLVRSANLYIFRHKIREHTRERKISY